jgi:2-dehydropantoate 2-reductase
MRIGIIGIGGVGGYYGGKLALRYEHSNEHEVIFIARGEHLRAIEANGLQLITPEGKFIVRPRIASDNPLKAGLLDLIFFCTKSYSLETAAQEYAACFHPETVAIPLLNGVNNVQRLRRVLPQADIISGCVYIISHLVKPGVIKQEGGSCKLIFGTDESASAGKYSHILDVLLKAQINATLTDKISEVLWTKYLLMCPIGSLTSATGKTYGGILDNPELRQKAKAMMLEVIAVAQAYHIHLPSDAVDRAMDMIAGFDYHSKTSMQLDFEKGKPTEIDSLTAYLCHAGRTAGVQTPLHDEIYKTLKKTD